MSWRDYYRLLEKYEGCLERATTYELCDAARGNPNDPISAKRLAEKKYQEAQDEASAKFADKEMFGDEAEFLPDDMGCK